jgi:hypothetical protein
MYTLFRSLPLRTLLATQAPSLLLSFGIAEFFYKFHSFTLECLAFLATWFVVDAAVTGFRNLWSERHGSVPTP